MLVSDIATRVRKQFGDVASVVIVDADIIRWINDGMLEIALNNNLLEKKATTSSVAGVANYGVPVDMLSVNTLRYDGQKLRRLALQEADEITGGVSDSGTPTHWWQEAQDFILYPTPASVKVITTIYTRTPVPVTLVSNTPELPVLYHNRLVEYCIAQAAELDDNLQLSTIKMQQFEGKTSQAKNSADEGLDFYDSISVSARDGWYDDFA